MINFLFCYSWNKFAHWVFCKLHTVSIFKNVNQGHLGWDREGKEREREQIFAKFYISFRLCDFFVAINLCNIIIKTP